MYKIVVTFLVLVFALISQLNAQSVGVVLSGGGAKGFAHIGVIRALEEQNIPIDYISGTSMGAIVAALYAIGYSPDEMEELLNSDDFVKWSYGYIDTEEEYYYKLKDDMPDWLEFPFKREGNILKPDLPTNVIAPFQMDLRFLQFFSPAGAAAGYDFNRLMVPFFCVASDVHNEVPVILSSGDLASSVRASMTFPGYFKPIMIDSVLLFDGGMENNFPADIMVERFSPDIIIGSKVAKNPEKPDSDDLYRQLENVFMKNTDYSIPANGILIEPDVERFNLLDFSNYDTIYQAGYRATYAKMDSIKLLIQSFITAEDLKAKRDAFKQKNKALIFQNIYISGVDNQTVEYILRNIRRNRDLLTFEELEEEYFKLLSDKIIKSIYPHTVYNVNTGYFDLYLEIKIKYELSILVGGNISSNLRNMGYVDLDYVFQEKNVYNMRANTMIGKFYTSFSGEFRMDFAPRKVDKQHILTPFYIDFMATTQKYDYFSITSEWFTDNESQSKIIQREQHFQANIGRPVNNRGILTTGFTYGYSQDDYFHTNVVARDDDPDQTVLDFTSVHFSYENSTLNKKQYANKGYLLKAQIRYITAAESYDPGSTADDDIFASRHGHSWFNNNVLAQKYYKPLTWFTLGLSGQLNYSNKKPLSNSIATLLNAPVFTPFPQSTTIILEKFRAYNWLGMGVVPILHLYDRFDFRTEVHLYQPYKYIQTTSFEPSFSRAFPAPRIMSSMAGIYHTPIGPLALTASYFMDEEVHFYFQLNFGYLLFNKKGLDY